MTTIQAKSNYENRLDTLPRIPEELLNDPSVVLEWLADKFPIPDKEAFAESFYALHDKEECSSSLTQIEGPKSPLQPGSSSIQNASSLGAKTPKVE